MSQDADTLFDALAIDGVVRSPYTLDQIERARELKKSGKLPNTEITLDAQEAWEKLNRREITEAFCRHRRVVNKTPMRAIISVVRQHPLGQPAPAEHEWVRPTEQQLVDYSRGRVISSIHSSMELHGKTLMALGMTVDQVQDHYTDAVRQSVLDVLLEA